MKKHWYAIYTKSRHEKKVYDALTDRGIHCFLPAYKTLKQWSDRKKWIDQVLFPSYLFVNIELSEYDLVIKTYSVVRFITFEGKAVIVPDQQIKAIEYYLSDQQKKQFPAKNLHEGDKVEIRFGQMAGLKGEIVEENGRNHVKVAIESVAQSLMISIAEEDLKKIS